MYPKLIKPYVLSFCRSICRNEPVWVSMRPLLDKPIDECFSIVPEHAIMSGGKQCNGWAIWEWPKVFIEAEFHCVWEDPAGELLDLTPKSDPTDKILFLPDSKRPYKGIRIENIRKPLSRDKDIERFLSLAHERHAEFSRIVKPGYYGEFTYSAKALSIENDMKMLQHRLCIKYGNPCATH